MSKRRQLPSFFIIFAGRFRFVKRAAGQTEEINITNYLISNNYDL